MRIFYYLIHGKSKRIAELEKTIEQLRTVTHEQDIALNGMYREYVKQAIAGTDYHNIEGVVCFDCYRMNRNRNG